MHKKIKFLIAQKGPLLLKTFCVLLAIVSALCVVFAAVFHGRTVVEDVTGKISPENGFCHYAPLAYNSNYDSLSNPSASDLVIFENGVRLGPAHSIHDTIRTSGKGAYSHWGNYVFFSSSDNSDPSKNGKIYTVKYKRNEAGKITVLVAACLLLFMPILRPFLKLKSLAEKFFTRKNLFIFICVFVFPVLSLFLVELVFRLITPKRYNEWPMRFDGNLGFVFKPDASFKYSGNLTYPYEFTTEQKSNSHGFLDGEHKFEKPAGVKRIVILGDSFVEAVQVNMNEKLQVKLEEILKVKGYNVEVLAFGYSGMNAANLWPFYQFSKKFSPDIVILFQNPDLTRDNPEYNSLVNGWNQDNPLRFYFNIGENGEAVPVFPAKSIAASPTPETDNPVRKLLTVSVSAREIIPRAAAVIEQILGYEYIMGKMTAFNPPGYEKYPSEMGVMLYSETPDAFIRKTYAYNETALKAYAESSRTENIGFAVVQQSGWLYFIMPEDAFNLDGYTFKRDYIDKTVESACKKTGIPFLSLNKCFSNEENPLSAFWKYDKHFNLSGHEITAKYIGEFLLREKLIK